MLDKITQAPQRLREFLKNVRNELEKVTWPNKKEVYGTTIVVIVTVFFFGFYLFLVDIVLRNGVEQIFEIFR